MQLFCWLVVVMMMRIVSTSLAPYNFHGLHAECIS